MADKEEWVFKGFVDLDRASDWLLNHDPNLADRYRRLAETPGTRYFQERRLREDARKQARHLSHALAEQVGETLSGWVTEALPLSLRHADTSGREMVLHLACLVTRAAVADVLARSQEMMRADGEALLTLEPSGPWPPFHFCPSLGGGPS